MIKVQMTCYLSLCGMSSFQRLGIFFRIKISWIELFAKNGEPTRQLNYSQSKKYDEKGWCAFGKDKSWNKTKRCLQKIKRKFAQSLFCRTIGL